MSTNTLLHKDSPWMPDFSKSHTKYMARELHIGVLYPLFTGNLWLPDSNSYWYLCNEQDNTEGSEIYQLTKKLREFNGKKYYFAKPNQCYGVDRGKLIIEKNNKLHPDYHWISGEWNVAIQNPELFNPGLVYLDTTSFAERSPAVIALKQTLLRCKRNTLVIANVMMGNSRAGNGDKLFDDTALIDNLLSVEHPSTLKAWNESPYNSEENIFHSYEYKTSKTLMRSYIFFKGVVPKTDLIMKEFHKFENWCSFSSQSFNF